MRAYGDRATLSPASEWRFEQGFGVALFGKKKDDASDEGVLDDGMNGASDSSSGVDSEEFSSAKADNFFSHARTTYESGNYEYSAQLWLRGLRWDPSDMDAVNRFWKTVQQLTGESKKKVPSKDLVKAASDAKGPIKRYLQEILSAAFRWDDLNSVIKAAEAAVGVDATDVADLFGQRAFSLVRQEKKPRKDSYVKLLRVFEVSGNFKLAVECGETARQLDPSDAQLQNDVRNMMARETMSSGGFDQAGEEGGFRRSIRDASKQADLEASDRITKTDDVKDRLVEAAKREVDESPDDPAMLDKYGKALRERGKPTDLTKALLLYSKLHSQTGQFRFRQVAGEIKVRMSRAAIARQAALVEKNPGDEEAREKLDAMNAELERTVLEELKLQEQNYPTDLKLKFRLGIALFNRGAFDESIAYFQEAQSDPKNRSMVLGYMGRAFSHLEGWESEAIQTLRKAIDENEDQSSDTAFELRYDLMTSLQRKAERDRDRAAAQEADELAASIAMERFSYRDIRDRRTQIKKLMDELKD